MMDMDKDLDAELDALFKSAPDDMPSNTLFAAVMADAAAAQSVEPVPYVEPKKPFWQRIGFGQEWAVGFSLAACACLGVFVGYSSPDILSNIGLVSTDAATDFSTWGSDTVLNVFDAYFVES